MTDTAHDYTTWDAPYVLGSLTRTERREYEDHLAGCPACQASVADLAGVPGMLALVDTEIALTMIAAPEAAAPESNPPVPELLPRLADAERRRRRRGRWASVGAAVAAAAAAVAIAVPVVYTVASSDNPTTTTEQVVAERSMQPLQPTPISASFKLVAAEGRTRIIMTCSYGASDQRYTWKYALFVLGSDGKQTELGQWPAGPGTELTIDRTLDAAPDQVGSVEIRSVATGERLLVGTV
ncbi:zf-HC2 domain-containing protein [Nocardia sp. NPDC051463]|uniref:anti-sigma factor family protein n=1 Tax=Nocardia sp. NPDC051463 TaxID=3154845 RepID=UPI00344E5BE4